MNRVALLIERDTSTKIPANVPEYEVPLLIEVHGEALVHFLDEEPVDDGKAFDADKAYDGLVMKYGQRVVDQVYPHRSSFLRSAGAARSTGKGKVADDDEGDADAPHKAAAKKSSKR